MTNLPSRRGYVFGSSPALDAPATSVPNAVLQALGEARWKEVRRNGTTGKLCEKGRFLDEAPKWKLGTNVTRSYSEFTTFSEKMVFGTPEINEISSCYLTCRHPFVFFKEHPDMKTIVCVSLIKINSCKCRCCVFSCSETILSFNPQTSCSSPPLFFNPHRRRLFANELWHWILELMDEVVALQFGVGNTFWQYIF